MSIERENDWGEESVIFLFFWKLLSFVNVARISTRFEGKFVEEITVASSGIFGRRNSTKIFIICIVSNAVTQREDLDVSRVLSKNLPAVQTSQKIIKHARGIVHDASKK